MASWKQESEVYKTRMYEKYGITLRESFDAESFKKNPKKFFNENNWIIPQEHFEEIVSLLARLAQSDSEISFEDVELGKRGEYIQEVVQKLMQTDKNFAANINKVMSNTHVQEGKKLVTFLVCLGLLLASMGAAHASTGQNISNNQGAAITQTIENENTKETSVKKEVGWKINMEKKGGGYQIDIEPDPDFEGDPSLNNLIKSLASEDGIFAAISGRLYSIFEKAVEGMVADGMSEDDAYVKAGTYFTQLLNNSKVNINLTQNQTLKLSNSNTNLQSIRNAYQNGKNIYPNTSYLPDNINFNIINNQQQST